jgi:flagellar biosynthesis protein FlhF
MKSYFADTVQMAVEQARRELGSDAALVTSRVSSADARHLGRYEVVFAFDAPLPTAPTLPPSAATPPAPPSATPSGEKEIQTLRRELDTWRRAALGSMDQPRWMLDEPELQAAYFHLLEAEVDRDLAVQLVAAARKALSEDEAQVQDVIAEAILRHARIDSSLGAEGTKNKIVALVGPPGAGKTAVAAKLAFRYGLAEGRRVALISYDSQRLAASEELRWYASVFGVPFQAAETNLALSQGIEEHAGKDLILIDTPGFIARDLAAGCEQADYLARREDIQKHLVLPVSMRSSDLARTHRAFDIFCPTRLLFTRLDESDVYGPILCESARSGRPLSFFGTGQRVPEDIEPAGRELLLGRLLQDRRERDISIRSAA